MAERKNGFLLYKDLLPQFEMLTDEQAGQLIKAILTYVNDLDLPPLEPEVRIAFGFIKAILKRDLKKYEGIVERNIENGKKGGRPTKEQNPENPVGYLGNPTKPKKADSDSGSDSERDTDSDIIKKPTPKGLLLDSIINEHTDDENLRKALREFVQYRNSNPKTKISDLGLTKSINQLTKMFGDNTADKIQSIDNTIANGWKGLFDIDKKGDKLTYGWQEELKAEQDKFDNRSYEPKRSAEEAKRKLDEL
jgi:hypothetical protein